LIEPPKRGRELAAQIATAQCSSPTLWWLGNSGFALKYRTAILYIDPDLSLPDSPLRAADASHAGLILCTHSGRVTMDTVPAMLAASPRAKLVIPKSGADHAHSLGIPYTRMVTTDAGLRVEYLDDRIYAVPSSHGKLDWTPLGGYPYLGYLVRFGGVTIYHAGDCVPYDDIVDRLRPYTVTVALLPVGGRPDGFDIPEAAQLSQDIGARWLVPMDYGVSNSSRERVIEHMLGHRPAQRFKVFEPGEMWTVPVEVAS
jgi:L-ascorbate metabolism protein UlaG (beta-lactamase superfamily)